MKKIFSFVLLSFCFVARIYSQDWISFKSTEGKFSISLPSQPTSQLDTATTYPTYTTTLFVSKTQTDFFIIGWVDYESSYTFDAQKELEANRDNFVKGINGTLISTKNTEFNGYKAIEFTASSGKFFWSSKVFLVGKRPYQLLAGSNTGKASKNENKFYNSFAITRN